MQDETLEAGKAAMRGLIHTMGISKAIVAAAETYSAPFNDDERDLLAGMMLAAYEAGQLDGAGKAWMDHV